jgi:hypothetical protein
VTREKEGRRRRGPGRILLMMRMRLRGSGILGRLERVGWVFAWGYLLSMCSKMIHRKHLPLTIS